MMIAIGTASNIPINPSVLAPISIQMKMSNELTHRVLFMIHGIRILFSHRCITKNKIPTPINPATPLLIVPTNNAGTLPISGPTYGMISVSHAIRASDKILGISRPNHDSISSPTPVIQKINRHNSS